MEIMTFQYYDFTDIFNKVLSLDQDSYGNSPLNDHFEKMGYQTLYIVHNLGGTLILTTFITPVIWLVTVVLSVGCRSTLVELR